VEAVAIGNQKSWLFAKDFPWQQRIFHVKAMEISRLPEIAMPAVGESANIPGQTGIQGNLYCASDGIQGRINR